VVKLLLKIRVVRLDGARIGWNEAVRRSSVDGLFGVVWLIGLEAGCPIKSRCTTGKYRRIPRWELESILGAMQERLDHKPESMRVRRRTLEHPFGTRRSQAIFTPTTPVSSPSPANRALFTSSAAPCTRISAKLLWRRIRRTRSGEAGGTGRTRGARDGRCHGPRPFEFHHAGPLTLDRRNTVRLPWQTSSYLSSCATCCATSPPLDT
jgi:hypothetical protein